MIAKAYKSCEITTRSKSSAVKSLKEVTMFDVDCDHADEAKKDVKVSSSGLGTATILDVILLVTLLVEALV